jgi:hypothetical protein
VDGFFSLIVECKLYDTGAVAQIDKDKAAEVALTLCPADYVYSLTDMLFSELAAKGGSSVIVGI